MTELTQLAAQFGFPALIAVVVFIAYQQLVRQLVEVVRANTAVNEKMTVCLDNHDERSARIESAVIEHDRRNNDRMARFEQPIIEIVQTTKRIETKLDQHHSLAQERKGVQ